MIQKGENACQLCDTLVPRLGAVAAAGTIKLCKANMCQNSSAAVAHQNIHLHKARTLNVILVKSWFEVLEI